MSFTFLQCYEIRNSKLPLREQFTDLSFPFGGRTNSQFINRMELFCACINPDDVRQTIPSSYNIKLVSEN